MPAQQEPLVRFVRFLPGLRPRRGDTSASGTLPHRAVQYCEPARLASAFGYLVFLPASFQLIWDGGTGGQISVDDGATWFDFRDVAYPGSFEAWDGIAPEACQGYCPPWITMSDDRGMVQVWTGWFARTRPGYSTLVRGPANLARPTGYEVLEGIVHTGQWFGPLFANLRLTRSEAPIRFDHLWPFLQVQPVNRAEIADANLDTIEVVDAVDMLASYWGDYEASLVPGAREPRRGHYASWARKLAREEERQREAAASAAGVCPFSGRAA